MSLGQEFLKPITHPKIRNREEAYQAIIQNARMVCSAMIALDRAHQVEEKDKDGNVKFVRVFSNDGKETLLYFADVEALARVGK